MEIDHGFTTDMKFAVAGTFGGGLSSKGYRLLKNEWYNVKKVYPVCPDKTEVEGEKAYASLKDLPEPVDVVVVVHKQDITTEVVKEAATLDQKPAIWFMPRTDSTDSVTICEENNMKYAMSCIYMHREIPGWKKWFDFHRWHGVMSGANRVPKQGS